MLFSAFKLLAFTIMVDETLGCCRPSARSLTEREVNFCLADGLLPLLLVLHASQNIIIFCSQMIWIRYIGHLECAPKTKRLV